VTVEGQAVEEIPDQVKMIMKNLKIMTMLFGGLVVLGSLTAGEIWGDAHRRFFVFCILSTNLPPTFQNTCVYTGRRGGGR
jgi:hypothetical protein